MLHLRAQYTAAHRGQLDAPELLVALTQMAALLQDPGVFTGHPTHPITDDDNVVAEGAQGFAQLGIGPVAMTSVLPEYLWRFRPSGQYDAIKESAQNLRSS